MPAHVTPQQYGQAVLEHAQSGSYPEDEDVISAELPPSALSEVSKLIEQARGSVRNDIKAISRSSAPDIDGWILQAKNLQVDVASSLEAAKKIEKEAQHGRELESEAIDAASKAQLLHSELAFNKSLCGTLERLQNIGQSLDHIRKAIISGQPLEAVKLIQDVSPQLPPSSTSGGTGQISDILQSRVAAFREETTEKLTEFWRGYAMVDSATSTLVIRRESADSRAPELASIAQALSELGMLDAALTPFGHDIEHLILLPRLQIGPECTVWKYTFETDRIAASEKSTDLSALSLFEDLDGMIDFLHERLPAPIMEPLAIQLMPVLIRRLISTWLASSVPENLDGMDDFQGTMDLANNFANKLRQLKWSGTRELADWMGSIPDIWLRKRQETSLSQVRTLLSKGFGELQLVERVETQVLDQDDDVLGGDDAVDDWNANWSDGDPASPVKSAHAEAVVPDDEDVDLSAWGLDDDKESSEAPQTDSAKVHTEDVGDDWGWKEDDQEEHQTAESGKRATSTKLESNGLSKAEPKAEKTITLTETYHITSLPKQILDIISQVISDASTLESPSQVSFPVASAASGLLSLPGLILTMYRACAASTYTFKPNGNMLLYNDTLWLAEQLRHKISDLRQKTAPEVQIREQTVDDLNLEVQTTALEIYGKRAYTKEMESQRTIITDLLDGAQGFSNCTVHPFNQECDIAIASTADRIRLLHKEWSAILSHSALLQSIGSLLTSVTSKMVMDIEDKSDISLPESQQLTKYCNAIAELEALFISQGPAQTVQAPPATSFYVPNWFRFQYLANILDSSLADIKYLWIESELSLEFEVDEVIDLILALFEDSDIRRKAIAEIRSHRPRRE